MTAAATASPNVLKYVCQKDSGILTLPQESNQTLLSANVTRNNLVNNDLTQTFPSLSTTNCNKNKTECLPCMTVTIKSF